KAGDTVSITSGRDTSLKGAQVSGETVKVDVGRDLTLQSEQDRNNYDSKQTSVSASGSFTFGTMTGSGSVSASKSKIDSDYTSVQEQTGFFAGKGGFDITVGEHTQLNGAVIGSTATADKNTLDTGTLGFSDLDNQASFNTSTSSMGLSSGGFTGSKDFISNMGGGIPITGGNSGDASSTTHAAVSDGTITIRDTDKQQQNVTDLSRDAEHANNALSPIFDKEKEQNRLREINLIGEIGNQVGDIAHTQGKIAEEKALKDPQAIQAAKEALAAKGNLTPTEKQLTEQIRNTAMATYGTGSDLQRAIQAATAVTQGLTGGNLGQALAGGSAPYLAHEISKYLPADQNQTANLMAHAVLGAVAGHFNGNATVGAVSAFTAEAAAPAIINAMGWDKDHLTEQQKQTVSALGTLAAGLAGGLVGDSSSSAVAGAQAGKNAVENNALGCSVLTCLNNPIDISRPSLGGGMAGVAGGAAIADALNGDKESESGPNVGKDQTDADKAELGGTGSGTPGGWEPQDEENARNSEKQNNTVEDLTSTSSKGNETTVRSKLFERTGGSNAANKEFDALSPTEIKDIPGGRVGKLPDGRTVIVRERSTDGRPTLEIQSGKNRIKFRYDE
ncbi:VENN motif pre-toxin domain-containing protein, partial [Yersinia intermedia]|uniref:VENN motif pre-toxin domain-containing protein n=1 Tax=Yersinia intermedia TaxID=631 RepID=UPI0025AA5082